MTMTFTSGDRFMEKLEVVQSFCCKVASSTAHVCCGWLCKRDECKKCRKNEWFQCLLLFLFVFLISFDCLDFTSCFKTDLHQPFMNWFLWQFSMNIVTAKVCSYMPLWTFWNFVFGHMGMEQSDSLLSLSYRLLNVWLEIYCAVGTRSWKELHSSCILLNHLLKGDIRHTEDVFIYLLLHWLAFESFKFGFDES